MGVDEFHKDSGLPPLFPSFSSFLLFPQVVDQSLHHLRANGALLVLWEDVPPCLLVGELCGPLKDQGFQEGVNPFLLPETNLVVEEIPILLGISMLVVGPSLK